jgi:hypothetical protein
LSGRHLAELVPCRAVKLMDALIAAAAIEHGLPIVTQDDDYEQLARAHEPLRVVKV